MHKHVHGLAKWQIGVDCNVTRDIQTPQTVRTHDANKTDMRHHVCRFKQGSIIARVASDGADVVAWFERRVGRVDLGRVDPPAYHVEMVLLQVKSFRIETPL